MTVHLPTAIFGPLITAAVLSLTGSYVWVLKKMYKFGDIIKELQSGQAQLNKEIREMKRERR